MCSAKGGFGAVFQLPPDSEDYPHDTRRARRVAHSFWGVDCAPRFGGIPTHVAKNNRLLLLRPRCHESACGWLAVA